MEYLQTLVSSSLRGVSLDVTMADFFDHTDTNRDNSVDPSESHALPSRFVHENSVQSLFWGDWPETFQGWLGLYFKFNIGFQLTLALIENVRIRLGLRFVWKWPTLNYKKIPNVPKCTIEKALHYDTPLPDSWFAYENLKTVFMTITGIAPLRISVFVFLFVYSCVLMGIALRGRKDGLWFKFWFRLSSFNGILIALVLGYYHINVKGQFDRSAKTIVSNHVCLCEVSSSFKYY